MPEAKYSERRCVYWGQTFSIGVKLKDISDYFDFGASGFAGPVTILLVFEVGEVLFGS